MALKDARASKKMTQEMQYFCNITHIVFVPYRSHKFFSFFFCGIFSGIFCDLQKISLIFTLIFAIRKIYRKYLR